MRKKLCPRARHNGKVAARFLVAKDPAVRQIARRVVSGIDRRYSVHPDYQVYVSEYGKDEAHKLIRDAVTFRGACDVIQTDMCLGGIGLFGGLSENGKEFIFYEWTNPQSRVHMTPQQARDIVSGKQKFVTFVPCTKAHYAARKRAKEKLEMEGS